MTKPSDYTPEEFQAQIDANLAALTENSCPLPGRVDIETAFSDALLAEIPDRELARQAEALNDAAS